MKRNFWILLIIVFLAFAWITPAFAQLGTPPPDDVNRVASQLYCPVCENTPLDVCPTQACAQWRNLIRDKMAAGWTDEQIKQYFADQYGVRVLATPPTPLIYIVPPILLLIGIAFLVRAYLSMRRKPVTVETAPTASPTSSDDQYLSQVEEELKKRN